MKTILPFLALAFSLCMLNMDAQDLPYSCNFDTPGSQIGWLYFEEGVEGASDWNMSGGGFSGPNALTHDYNVGAASNDLMIDWMVSPPLITPGPISIEMMVRQMGFSTPTVDNCELYMITGDPNPENGGAVFIGNISSPGPSETWSPLTFTFASLVGEFRLAFRYKTLGAAWCTYAIDDLYVSFTTAVPNLQNKVDGEELNIYPNPFNEIIYAPGIDIFDNPTVTLYDVTGQLVQNALFFNQPVGSIALPDLKPGYYVLRIEDNKGRFASESIVKL